MFNGILLRRRGLIAGATVALGLVTSLAWADAPPVRVAVVDTDALIQNSEPGKKLLAGLNDFFRTRQKEVRNMEEQIQQIRSRAAKEIGTATEQQQALLQRQFDEKSEDLQRFKAEASQELEKKRQEVNVRFDELVKPIVKSVGKDSGYAMIFRKFDSGLMYVDDAVDITALIIQKLNAAAARP